MPLQLVRLSVPLPEIERRLRASASTAARLRDDLPRAAAWLAESAGEGIEDLTVENDGPVREVAERIVRWLGWA